MSYKKSFDYIFWITQRLTGIFLFIYMLIHAVFTFILKNDKTHFFANLVKSFFIIKFLEYLLILTVIAHTLIGIRVLLLEIEFISTKKQYLNNIILFIFSVLAILFFIKLFLTSIFNHV